MIVVHQVCHITAPEAQDLDLNINCELSAKDDESAEAVIDGVIFWKLD